VEVYAKLELQNPFGMKDRVARNIILEAERTGVLLPGAPIVESSSGTMALGVALVGRSLGHDVHIVTDPRIDRVTLEKLRALGCEIHIVRAMTNHGWQGARLERLGQLIAELPGAFWPQQYSNPDNPGAYRELADELLAHLDRIDVLVGAVGSGGSLTGSARALRRVLPKLRVVGVDCIGSALFGQPDMPKRLQSGLGNSLLPKNLDRRLIDEVHWLNDHEAFAASRALARQQQIFGGNTSGSVYRVLGDYATRVPAGTRIVGIFPDRGDRYIETVYSDEHWSEHRLEDLRLAEVPAHVDYGTVVHSWSRASTERMAHDPAHLLFVEANTSGTGVLALRTARSLGLRPVLLARDHVRYADVETTGCEILVCDTNSISDLRAAVQQRFRREEIAGVMTTSDFYTPAVAELTTWLGLLGNNLAAVTACRNKAILRARLAEAGVAQPSSAVVTDAAEVADAIARIGLPCVVKPADDSGSNDVLLCATVQEAIDHVVKVLAVRFNVRGLPTAGAVLVEEYLDGPEFSVEMFGGPDGISCVGITEKSVAGAPFFVERRHIFPAPVSDAVADKLIDAARRAVAATGMRYGATHTEVKLTAKGAAIIEINPRLAGGMIPELIRLATGTDLLEQQVRLASGLEPQLAESAAKTAGIQFLLADREGTFAEFAGIDAATKLAGVAAITVTARPGRPVRPAQNAYDRLGYVIACHDDAGQVEKILTIADNMIELRTER
jgi:cysteine synthase A